MIDSEREVWQTLLAWRAQGHRAALATVIRTYGSSPRPAGAMVALREDGVVVGSVSGGCIEADLIERVRAALPALPERLVYGGSAEENRRLGLPCGGALELVWEPAPPPALIQNLLDAAAARTPVARRLDLSTGTSALVTARAQPVELDKAALVVSHLPRVRLLLIGAVQIARHLAEMAQALDYAVSVCEPREEYRASWAVAGAPLVEGMPDDAVAALRPDSRTAIVALTHDPKLDDLALLEALRSDAFYVGALGSRRSNARRRERLALLDLAPEHIARLRGPVGLPIGSHTPAEIAVAILADLIAVANGVSLLPARDETAAPLIA